MSEKKDLKQEDLNKVTGGVNFGRQVDINQNNLTAPVDTNFKPEDVNAAMTGGEEEGPENVVDSLK